MNRAPVTPSLFAPDLPKTVRFYVDVLGFRKTGSYVEDDGSEIWAEVALGEARVWFFPNALTGHAEPVFSGLIYVFVDDVDALAARLEGQVAFEWGPETQEYGLRELGIKDINGYYLVFARDV